MIQLFRISAVTLFCLNLCIASTFAGTVDHNDIQRTQVVIVGTIHKAHYKNPNYSPDILREIILNLKPDAILNELPLSHVDPNGRPLHRDPLKHPECWASDTVAQQLGIRQIPFDRPDRQENFRKTRYFERQRKSNELANKCGECVLQNEPNSIDIKIAQLQGYVGRAEAALFLNAGPEIINSEAHDSVIRMKQSLRYEIVPQIIKKYSQYPQCKELIEDDQFFQDQWNVRNKIMADNIIKAATEYVGKRLVVITGATHRYILHDLLKDKPDIELKEYWEIIGTATSSESSEMRKDKAESIVESSSILHITSRDDWNEALGFGQYNPKSMDTVGYIHCSKLSQIIEVANHHFKGQKGLVLLVIEPKKVKSEIKYEGPEPTDLFPHVYGALNLDAVVDVLDFTPCEDGTFKLP